MVRLEKRAHDLGRRITRRMNQWRAAADAKDVDEAYRHLSAAGRLHRKRDAVRDKMRLRGMDLD